MRPSRFERAASASAPIARERARSVRGPHARGWVRWVLHNELRRFTPTNWLLLARRGRQRCSRPRVLGGRSQKIPEETRIKHHWVRTATCYDYPIAGTGRLANGFTVADQFEICISEHRNTVVSITPKPSRAS
jgi:hypothetical protein